jgi:hypothetical protein
MSDDQADDEDSREPTSLEQAFEREYDRLGPVDFAKRVIQFGDHLGRGGGKLSPAEKERALAEYSFLQSRLSFWLAYEYKPPTAQGNLLSAARILFQGADNAGIVGPGHLPKSMLDVAGDVWAYDNLQPRVHPSTKPKVDIEPAAPAEALKEVEVLGAIVGNSEAKIDWSKGVKAQGGNWEVFRSKQNPQERILPPTSKTFDKFNDAVKDAISEKTMNTLSVSYIMNPLTIYWRMRRYINAAADYEPRWESDLKPARILSKTIQLAIPEYTSPTQWGYLYAAIIFGKERGVRIVTTRIRE